MVSLVGYTNAGKSSILRALSGADLFVEDRLFATLDSATRAVELDAGYRALANWPDATVADELLEIANEKNLPAVMLTAAWPFL